MSDPENHTHPAPEPGRTRDTLWHHADFLKLWGGQTISELGSRITRDGLPLLAVLNLNASPPQMGILAAAGSIPVLLISLFAGVWIDRLPRRPLMIVSDLSRALILATVPLAALQGWLNFTQLWIIAALVGVFTLLFNVSYAAYLPSLVNRSHIVEGNSKLALSSSLAEFAGPGLAGWLVQVISAPIAILVDSLSFLASVFSLTLIKTPEPAPAPVENRRPVWVELKEGIRLVYFSPLLRSLAASAATRSFFGSFFGVLYGLYAIRFLGLGPAALGLTIAVGGVGDFLGALMAQPALKRFGLGNTLIGSLILSCLANFLIPLAGRPLAFAISLLVASQLIGDAFRSVYAIHEISLRQSIIPDQLLGRTNASLEFLVTGIGPLGALVCGLLGASIGVRPTLWAAAAGSALSLIWLLFSPVRGLIVPPPAPTDIEPLN